MRLLIFITFSLAFAICSQIPVIDQWEANFRARLRAQIHDYLPATPDSPQRRALLRETYALPDSEDPRTVETKRFQVRRWFTASSVGALLLAGVNLGQGQIHGTEIRRVWIDTDLSFGSPFREVDDAYALVLARHSPELQIAGLSTSYGNAPLRAVTRRTQDLVERLGLTTPVISGANSPNDLGRSTPATESLAATLRKNERLTYIALGPLTNLASFLILHPKEATRIDQIIMVAGHSPGAVLGFGPGRRFQIHDANVVKDSAAIRTVLKASAPILIAPIETSSDLILEKQDLQLLRRSSPVGQHLANGSGVWLWFWKHIVRAKGGPCFDALAVIAAAQPGLLKLETRRARVEAKGELIVRENSQRTGRRVLFCTAFAAGTKEFFLDRLSDRPEKSSSAPHDRAGQASRAAGSGRPRPRSRAPSLPERPAEFPGR